MMTNGNQRGLFPSLIRRIFIAQIIILLGAVACVVLLSLMTVNPGLFIFSFFAGCLGGSISLIRRLPSEKDETLQQLNFSWITSMMPLLHGGIMAMVIYCLFISGILTGDAGGGLFTSNLFPNFNRTELASGEVLNIPRVLSLVPENIMDIGKLLIWSFVAGYSEKFVAGILSSLEKRGTTAKP